MNTMTSIAFSLLRAYDIRGVYGRDLTEQAATELGQRFGFRVTQSHDGEETHVVIARDGRTHSPQLAAAFIEGLRSVGCHVVDIGLAPTPAVSFAVREKGSNFQAGVMVTGSHNPPEHNGFKLTIGHAPFFGDSIQNLMNVVIPSAIKPGDLTHDTAAVDRYTQHLLAVCPSLPAGLRVVWDCGHGATGPVVQALSDAWKKQGSAVDVLYGDIDGTFPAHSPDPSNAKNMADLIAAVNKENSIGLGLDGDGDRLGVVLPLQGLLPAEHTLWHVARERLQKNQGKTVLMDVKMSAQLPPLLKAHGGESFVWKTGHAHIKNKMSEIKDVVVAGEASGHFFFPELGYDDGLYAAVCVLASYNTLHQSVAMYPPSCITPELRLSCSKSPHDVIEELRHILDKSGCHYDDLDGVRIESDSGWWLARASHTESVITVRIESFSGELGSLAKVVYKLLEQVVERKSLTPLVVWTQHEVEKIADKQLGD